MFRLALLLLFAWSNVNTQEFVPPVPTDRAQIYTLDDQNKLFPLPFEQGQTPLRTDAVAKSQKVSYIELKGEDCFFLPVNGRELIRLSWSGLLPIVARGELRPSRSLGCVDLPLLQKKSSSPRFACWRVKVIWYSWNCARALRLCPVSMQS